MLKLQNIFEKTVLMLERDGLWPTDESGCPVDYAKGGSLQLKVMPDEWDLVFSVDFGGSEGIYIDFLFKYNVDGVTLNESFGTIKTLSDSREAFALFAALGANFTYYARRELFKALESTFPSRLMRYEVYTMENARFSIRTMNIDDIVLSPEVYAGNYRRVTEGEYKIASTISFFDVCKFILQKSQIERAFAFGETDVIVLRSVYLRSGLQRQEAFIYTGEESRLFVPVNLCHLGQEVENA